MKKGLVLLVLCYACSAQQAVIANLTAPNQSTKTALILLLEERYGGPESSSTQIISSEKELKKFLGLINKTRKPGLRLPKIDFTKNQVLISCAGITSEPKTPTLEVFFEDENTIVIEEKFTKYNLSTDNKSVTSPFVMYKLPLLSKKISFKNR